MKRITRIRLLIFALASGPLTAETPDELITRLQEKYERIRSFSADFEQLFQSRHSQLREVGVLIVKKPGKMYWEYRDPTPKVFISDGERSYFYVPRYNQLIVSDLDPENAPTPLLFLLGEGNLKTDFSVQFEKDEKSLQAGNTMLRLTPGRPQAEFSHIILEIRPLSFLIYRLIVFEPLGNRNEYILTNLREDVTIPDRRFRIRIPEGVEVIRQ